MVSKEAFKWNDTKKEWVPYFKMTYQYSDNEITINYAQWNESYKAYNRNAQKSVYELNEENIPTANKIYKQEEKINDLGWT